MILSALFVPGFVFERDFGGFAEFGYGKNTSSKSGKSTINGKHRNQKRVFLEWKLVHLCQAQAENDQLQLTVSPCSTNRSSYE